MIDYLDNLIANPYFIVAAYIFAVTLMTLSALKEEN